MDLRRLVPRRFCVNSREFLSQKRFYSNWSGPNAIISALRDVLSVFNVEIEDEAVVRQAIEWYEKGMDFADALHVASAGRKRKFATFDNRLRQKVRRLGLGELADI